LLSVEDVLVVVAPVPVEEVFMASVEVLAEA
jgi:hypothetical protein